MGKSGIVARKIAATLSSTGTPALFLHPAEAVHGDLGILVRGDVVVALSSSGQTEEILNLLVTIKRLGIGLISMTGDRPDEMRLIVDAVMKAYLEKMPTKTWVLLVVPAVALAYPIATIVVPAVLHAVIPEVVRSVLSVI